MSCESKEIEKGLEIPKTYRFYLWKENSKSSEVYPAFSIKEAMRKLSEEHKNIELQIYAMEIIDNSK